MERIYLDNNANSVMDAQVVDFMVNFLHKTINCNASSIHADGRKARSILENSRQQIANSLGFDAHKDDIQIIFTSSGTEANNLAIHNYKEINLFAGATEHVSILEAGHPAQIIVPVNQDGIIDKNSLIQLLRTTSGSKLVSIMLANNETGVIQEIKTLVEIAHSEGAIFHCDASQAFCKIGLNFKDLGCDLMTISSHKCGGPVGSAALIAKKSLNLKPMIKGGKQEQGVRAGTENLLAIAGFGVAAQLCDEKIGKFKELNNLRNYMEKEILNFAPDAMIIGSAATRLPNTSSIRMPNVKSEEQLIKFDLEGISVSSGSACSSGRISSSHVLRAMKLNSEQLNEVIRVSSWINTSKNQIDKFINLWKKIYNQGKNK